jgi:hypothetical protein
MELILNVTLLSGDIPAVLAMLFSQLLSIQADASSASHLI